MTEQEIKQIKALAQAVNHVIDDAVRDRTKKLKLRLARLIDILQQPSLFELLGEHEKESVSEAIKLFKES